MKTFNKLFYHNELYKPTASLNWQNLQGSSISLALARAMLQLKRPLLVVAEDAQFCARLAGEVQFFCTQAPEFPILTFPNWETLPYDRFSPHQDIISERILTLYKLLHLKQGMVITTANTLLQRLSPTSHVVKNSFLLRKAEILDLELLKKRLAKHGYYHVSKVMEHGEFAVRGSIIDIFPMGSDQPFRIDLFDQQIDSIRYFDPDTQRSTLKVDQINLLPAKEFPLTEPAIDQFRKSWRATFSGISQYNPIYQSISRGESIAGIEYYLPLFFQEMSNLFAYLPENSVVINFARLEERCRGFLQEVKDRYEQLRYDKNRPLLPPVKLFLTLDEVFAGIKKFPRIKIETETAQIEEVEKKPRKKSTTLFAVELIPDISIDSRAAKPLAKLAEFLAVTQHRVLFIAESLGRRESLLDLLKTIEVNPTLYNSWQNFLDAAEPIGIIIAQLEQGFSLGCDKITLITEAELFGQKLVMQRRFRKTTRHYDVEAVVRDLTELRIGAPVVHLEYGIGRYLGLQNLRVGEIEAEYLTLEYANKTKLYVPVASLHLISRYTGTDPEQVVYNVLGSKQWEKAKRKAIEKIRDVAAELLDLYAKRIAQKGYAFKVPELEYQKFVANFPFEETQDQQKAILDVMQDMQAGKNMDRLICGDVGFGKTEVAMRAAFIAIFNHKQVALLSPTTILVQQHYNNFCDRFADLPVNIALLSRFRSAKQQEIILQKLQAGEIDIVIGTHKLLQPTVKFKDLGLLIIDEEHRFGVRQKERIKNLRPNIDVLTLTATPIPRTLNMAFVGIRDFSIIATPPLKRLAIKTFLHERDNNLIREAMLREILRGGQVYFLHNKVATIEKVAVELQQLVPNVRIAVAHGQMLERQLEKVMSDFYHLRYNVLVCTTIIESGIDIPTANTIIIDRANRFGLAQLHQLRGRVGRSHHQAYAYLLVPSKKNLSSYAARRLEVITAMEDLGAGFSLASHDLEIRGAGELLGEEQSGQIESIGFSLYTEYLDRAIKLLKKDPQIDLHAKLEQEKTITEIDLKIPALIPENYIRDVNTRLVLYKRIANARNDAELHELQEEIIDRFGLLPCASKNLFSVTKLRLEAEKSGVRKITAHAAGGVVEFSSKPNVKPENIVDLIQKHAKQYKLRNSNKLVFYAILDKAQARIDFVAGLLNILGT